MLPLLDGIDHIHVYVADREKAAAWYRDILGFRVSEALAVWAEDLKGPLTIEDATGKIHVALFQVDTASPSSAIAFRANGREFLQWKEYLEDKGLLLRCADHDLAWSLYFSDCDGNKHEITTYEHDIVASRLNEART